MNIVIDIGPHLITALQFMSVIFCIAYFIGKVLR